MGAEVAVKLGIAGWSYEDWKGIVYPRGCKDTLRFCAEFVDVIEVNSTFYHRPSARNCESWVVRTDELGTEFTAKIPGEFTHEMSRDTDAVRESAAGFEPLAESGRLLTLLLQFSYRFEYGAEAMGHLRFLRDAFGSLAPLTVEVRHRSFNDQAALTAIDQLGIGVANLDYAGAATGFGMHVTGRNGPHDLAYYRLHGRSQAWFDKDAGRDDVYDYHYAKDEVAAIADRTADIAAGAAQAIVIANNHFQGKAMKLVLELLATRRHARIPVPEPMLRQYPELGDIAARPPGMLF